MFEQIWVISLTRRHNRLARFLGELKRTEWPFLPPAVFSAIDGDKVGVPKYWQSGSGSYGCLRSHLSILERAIQDDVRSILVMEDDAVFAKGFRGKLDRFLERVPSDWQCLMLGGQHVESEPIPVSPGVVRAGGGGGIQRTHCYGIRGREPMRRLYQTWANAVVHCDWVMGPCMAQFNTYAPDPFLVSQAQGMSDISGANLRKKSWRVLKGDEPVVLLRTSRAVMEQLAKKGWHGGYQRDEDTGLDVGLEQIFAEEAPGSEGRITQLKEWIALIQREALDLDSPGICMVWHPAASVAELSVATAGPILEIIAESAEEAIAQLPPELRAMMEEFG